MEDSKTPEAITETKVATPVTKKTVKTAVKKPAVKAKAKAKAPVAKAKVKKVRKAKEISAVVSPVIATITGLITDPATTSADLKSLRLELRKFVRSSRAELKARKEAATTEA